MKLDKRKGLVILLFLLFIPIASFIPPGEIYIKIYNVENLQPVYNAEKSVMFNVDMYQIFISFDLHVTNTGGTIIKHRGCAGTYIANTVGISNFKYNGTYYFSYNTINQCDAGLFPVIIGRNWERVTDFSMIFYLSLGHYSFELSYGGHISDISDTIVIDFIHNSTVEIDLISYPLN